MSRSVPLLPRSPFSTPLSGSAKEAELRIRSIFQWKKKRPPLWLLGLAALAALLCGSLVSCQTRPSAPALTMEVQYYDMLGNWVEVPALVFPDGREAEEGMDVSRELSALAQDYRAAIDAIPQGQAGDWFRCLCYPSLTDR